MIDGFPLSFFERAQQWEDFHARVNHALDLEAEGMAGRVCLVPEEGQPPQSTSGEVGA